MAADLKCFALVTMSSMKKVWIQLQRAISLFPLAQLTSDVQKSSHQHAKSSSGKNSLDVYDLNPQGYKNSSTLHTDQPTRLNSPAKLRGKQRYIFSIYAIPKMVCLYLISSGQVIAGVNGESEPGTLAPDVDAFEIFNTACKVGNGFC